MLSPCTTHPDFIFRFRAYVMTVCFCTIATPSFLQFEKAIDLVDFVFEVINCRLDSRRPSLDSLTSIFFAMFGEYGHLLQITGLEMDA